MTADARDVAMLQAIDGTHRSRVEFEEKCRLRTLAAWGYRWTIDPQGFYRVDWSTVDLPAVTR